MTETPGKDDIRYVLAALILFGIIASGAALSLKWRDSAERQQLAHSVYVYTVKDKPSEVFANHLRDTTGITVLEVESKEGENFIRNVLNKDSAVSPTLYVKRDDQYTSITGSASIQTFLSQHNDTSSPVVLGLQMIMVQGLIFPLLALMWKKASYFARCWPLVGIIAISVGNYYSCSTCIGISPLEKAASIAAICSFVLLFLMLNIGNIWSRTRILFAYSLSIGIIATQGILLYQFPKFCGYCLIASIAAFLTAISVQGLLTTSRAVIKLSWASRICWVAVGALAITTTIHGGVKGGNIDQSETKLPDFWGQKLPEKLGPVSSAIILVKRDGCHPCDLARNALTEHDIDFLEIDSKVFLSTLKLKPYPFSTPLIMSTDANGKVTYYHYGWYGDAILVNEILQNLTMNNGEKNETKNQ